MSNGFTNFKNGINIQPKSADPSSPVEGDIYYSDGTPRDEGLWLYKDAAWTKIPLGAVSASFVTVTKTTTATLATTNEDNVIVDATSGDFTITLPAASGNSGLTYRITKSTSANKVTVDGHGSETIGGELSAVLSSKDDSIIITCDGSNWFYLSDDVNYSARYTSNSGATISAGSFGVVDFEDVSYDTHSAVTTGASWKFTAPVSGYYAVSCSIIVSTTQTAIGEIVQFYLYKNGSAYAELYFLRMQYAEAVARSFGLAGSTSIYLSKGDYIDVRVKEGLTGTGSLASNNEFNHISIERIK